MQYQKDVVSCCRFSFSKWYLIFVGFLPVLYLPYDTNESKEMVGHTTGSQNLCYAAQSGALKYLTVSRIRIWLLINKIKILRALLVPPKINKAQNQQKNPQK